MKSGTVVWEGRNTEEDRFPISRRQLYRIVATSGLQRFLGFQDLTATDKVLKIETGGHKIDCYRNVSSFVFFVSLAK